MTIPIKTEHPILKIEIPSTKKISNFRPFLVKEEKIMLIAKESKNIADIRESLVQVINNCSLDKGFKVDRLTLYDIEWVFLKLRESTVSNVVELSYIDAEDKQTYNFKVAISDIEMKYPEGHEYKFKVNDDMTVYLSDPTFDKELYTQGSMIDTLIKAIKDCLLKVSVGNEMYNFSDFQPEEIDEFIDNLPPNALDGFEKYFETMPSLYYEIKYKNKNEKERVIRLTTLEDFFSLR